MSSRLRFLSFVLLLCLLALTAMAQGPVPGQNVNMVSGTKWPGGDPFLERQNEPSLAVSTRNSLHLLAGANDYRTVDLNVVDQLPINTLAGDAWLGVFKSFDGGRTWRSTLLPGFPQDLSTFGAASPMKGFEAASDPTVRSGTNGMFYYSGIGFNRTNNLGGLFLARFIDLNNRENGDASQPNYPQPSNDPIRYIGTVELDSGSAGQFIDKPWMATDIPRAGAGQCSVSVQQAGGGTVTQTFPAGNIYVAYAMFVGGQVNIRSKINFVKSSDCGATWTKPIMLSQTYAINQGTSIAVDPETGYVYVAWRVFQGGSDADSIVVVKSTDGGNTFSKAVAVASYSPYSASNPPMTPAFFDQGTSATSFRTNAVPTIAVDDSGSASLPGRVYVAWSQRGVGVNGDARIVLSSSTDGLTWSAPTAVDNGAVTDDQSDSFTRGHQVMPAITFNQGKLMVVYYDLRLDHTVGYFSPNTQLGIFGSTGCSNVDQGPSSFVPDCLGRFYLEGRDYVGDVASAVFGPYIDDAGLTIRRHTLDVMVAQSNGGATPAFTTARVSRYDFGLPSDKEGQDELEQLKVNPPNLPMFSKGTVPFIGDYIDIVGQPFVPIPGSNAWAYNNPNNPALAGATLPSPVHFASWTSNQDVVPPADGDWTKYIPVTNGTSILNGSATQPCTAGGWEGDRNENIYESRITQGLLVSSPQNSKPLSTTVQRAFVVLVQNFTNFQKTFRLTIANQPPGNFAIAGVVGTGGYASFQQALPNQPALPNPLPAPVTTQNVTIQPHSGAAATVFALSNVYNAPMTVNVNETDASNHLVASGLSGFVVLNADGTVPPLADPDDSPASIAGVELYTPNITTPNITTPNITTPNITTPNITTPNITTPNITTPNITTPNITTPNITTTTVSNPNITTPNITTPNITTTPVSDATYTFTNGGNTTAHYHVRVVGDTSTPLQLIASQIYTTPTSVNCQLIPQQQNITLAATPVTATPLSQVGNPNITTPGTEVTIEVAPGDTAYITLRGNVDTTTMQQIVTETAPVVVPQAVATNSTATLPTFAAPLLITTAALANGVVNTAYSAVLQAIGGTAPYGWSITTGSLPPGLTLNGATIGGTPTTAGTYGFTVQAVDSANPAETITRALSIQIIPQLVTNAATLPGAIVGIAYSPQQLTATGGVPPYCWSLSSNTCAVGTAAIPNGNGFTLTAPEGTIAGTPLHMGTTQLTLYVSDSGTPTQTKAVLVTIPVSGPQITTTSLPGGNMGGTYNATLTEIGGIGTLAWSVSSGALPTGVTLDPVTGILSGTLTAPGTFNFTVEVMDSNGNYGTQAFAVSIVVTPFLGTVLDPSGDTNGGVSNADLISGSVATAADGTVTLSVRFAAGTFDNQTTEADFLLDTDQNPSTGHQGADSGCSTDHGLIGGDYLVVLQSGFANNQATIYRSLGVCNSFAVAGTAPVTIVSNGMDVSFPLSLLTNTASATTSGNANSGPWNFVVTSDYSIGGNTFSGLIDVMPDAGTVGSTSPLGVIGLNTSPSLSITPESLYTVVANTKP